MDFNWAVRIMKDNHAVTRKEYARRGYGTLNVIMEHNSFTFRNCDNSNLQATHFSLEDIEAHDWELFEEPKPFNLSLRRVTYDAGDGVEYLYREEDVKELIKQLKDYVCTDKVPIEEIAFKNLIDKINTLIGERLK